MRPGGRSKRQLRRVRRRGAGAPRTPREGVCRSPAPALPGVGELDNMVQGDRTARRWRTAGDDDEVRRPSDSASAACTACPRPENQGTGCQQLPLKAVSRACKQLDPGVNQRICDPTRTSRELLGIGDVELDHPPDVDPGRTGRPEHGRARSTPVPWGSRIPALGRTRTQALTTRRSLAATLEGLAGDPLVGLDVARAGAGDDVVGDRGGGSGSVPALPPRPSRGHTACRSSAGRRPGA